MVLEYAPQFDVDLLSARVVKLVDTRDLKSLARKGVPVRLRLRAPVNLIFSKASLTILRAGFINSRFSSTYPKRQCDRITTL